MTGNELRDLLQKTAADGSDYVEVDEDGLIDRIRRRRIRSSSLLVGGVAVVVAVVGLGTAWVVRPDGRAPAVAGGSSAVVAPVPFQHRCGAALLGDHPVESPLRVTIGRQEIVRQRGDGEYGRVDATLTNSSDQNLAGATASAVRVVVVKDGAVVATTGAITANALPVTLGPGQSETLVVPVPLRHCTPTTAESGSGPALEPGTYQLYTEYSVAVGSPRATPGAEFKVLRSGPWTVDLK